MRAYIGNDLLGCAFPGEYQVLNTGETLHSPEIAIETYLDLFILRKNYDVIKNLNRLDERICNENF